MSLESLVQRCLSTLRTATQDLEKVERETSQSPSQANYLTDALPLAGRAEATNALVRKREAARTALEQARADARRLIHTLRDEFAKLKWNAQQLTSEAPQVKNFQAQQEMISAARDAVSEAHRRTEYRRQIEAALNQAATVSDSIPLGGAVEINDAIKTTRREPSLERIADGASAPGELTDKPQYNISLNPGYQNDIKRINKELIGKLAGVGMAEQEAAEHFHAMQELLRRNTQARLHGRSKPTKRSLYEKHLLGEPLAGRYEAHSGPKGNGGFPGAAEYYLA